MKTTQNTKTENKIPNPNTFACFTSKDQKKENPEVKNSVKN